MKHCSILGPVFGAGLLCEQQLYRDMRALVYYSLCSSERGLFVL